MGMDAVQDLVRSALGAALWTCVPVLVAGFAVGILVSLAQIVTSIQDPAVGAVPRLAALAGVLAVSLPWMGSRLVHYTINLWSDFGPYGR